MNPVLPRFLDVSVPWAIRHEWAAGQNYRDPEADKEMSSLWLMLEGEAHVTVGGRQWIVGPECAALWPLAARREMVTPHGAKWLSIRLRATLWGHLDLLQLLWPPVVWQPDTHDRSALKNAMESLVDEWTGAANAGNSVPTANSPATINPYIFKHVSAWPSRETTAALLCDAYARAVVGLCWRMLAKVDLEDAADANFPSWLGPILQELRARPDVPIDQLAHEAGISPTQLRRQFQKWFGVAPRQYLNRLRLEEARQLLESGELPVQEVAERVGFLSLSHFNRAFKTAFGMPPARYRHISRTPNSL